MTLKVTTTNTVGYPRDSWASCWLSTHYPTVDSVVDSTSDCGITLNTRLTKSVKSWMKT